MKLALVALAALAVAFAVGLGLGALAWILTVVGMWALVTGLVVGVAIATLTIAQGLALRRPATIAIALAAAAVGWVTARVMEDDHLIDQHRAEVARARAASTGLPPRELEAALAAPGAIDYWARGAEAELEAQVVADIGFGGIAGRWWWSAGNGVRLAGSWSSARGLPVGRVGAALWGLAELAFATWIATRVAARARVRAGSSPSA